MVVIKRPGCKAEAVSIRRMTEVETMIDGTPIKCLRLETKHGTLDGYCDDDGYKKGLPPNFGRPTDGHMIVGPIVICTWAYTKDGPDWVGLSPELVAEAIEMFATLGLE